MMMTDYLRGCDVLGADAGSGYTDSWTVGAVQRALMALPQYKTDPKLSLAPYNDDGKWGPTTARAVERFNSYYRAGGAADNDGPHITDGTLAALRIPLQSSSPPPLPPSPFPIPAAPSPTPIPWNAVPASAAAPVSAAVVPPVKNGLLGWKIALGALGAALLTAGVVLGVRPPRKVKPWR